MVFFLRHIIYLLMRMVFYVNHGGLQADLKGGSGGAAAPPGKWINESFVSAGTVDHINPRFCDEI